MQHLMLPVVFQTTGTPNMDSPVAKGLEFHYDSSPQGSPQWLAIKRGRIGASKLGAWLSVSKAEKTLGKPLKARLDYEKQLMFERQFNTSFEVFVTSAMQEGIEFEDWAAKQYEQITGSTVMECGCYYNEFFVASPDRLVVEGPPAVHRVRGLIEIKVLKDSSFISVLSDGVIDAHYKQIQGQLWATNKKWCDYVAVNMNSRQIAIIRVERDEELIDYLKESVQEKLVVEPFKMDVVHNVVGEIPTGLNMEEQESNDNGGW